MKTKKKVQHFKIGIKVYKGQVITRVQSAYMYPINLNLLNQCYLTLEQRFMSLGVPCEKYFILTI